MPNVQLRKFILPNGTVMEFDNGTSVEDVRSLITAAGGPNLAGAPATERPDGSVQFHPPVGGSKS